MISPVSPRSLEWWTQDAALAAARGVATPEDRAVAARARGLFEGGVRLLQGDPLPHGASPLAAALLFRASLDASQRGKAEPDPEDDAASLGEMTVGEQLEAAVRLRRRAKNAVEAVEQVSVEEGRVLRKRRLRLFQALSIWLAIVGFVLLLWPVFRGKDLLAGKLYRLSSSFAECHPKEHECGGNPRTRILFHTLDEESPWVEYDLGSVQRLSRIEVRNRTDDVTDRAVPLIVELGDEKRVWKQVARKNEDFVEWTAKFPTASARYVRLRVDRRSALHLERVSARP